MKFFDRKKYLLGILMVIIGAAEVFILVFEGNLGAKMMILAFAIIAVGIDAYHRGKNEIKKMEYADSDKQQIAQRASSITMYIIQLCCGLGMLGTVIVGAIMDVYAGTFNAVIILLASVLMGSTVIETIIEKVMMKRKG